MRVKHRLQAYAYAGRNVSDPVGAAAKDILAKYDISGAVRAPKGTIGAVMPALQYLQANPEQLEIAQPNSSNPALAEMDRRDREYRAIRSQGFWVTNNDETGYVLKVPSEYPGQTRSVRGKDGQPVTVLLRDIMAGNYVGKTGPYASDVQKRQAVRDVGALGGAQKQWQADQGAYGWGAN